MLLVRVDKAAPPPFEALRPIYRLPAEIRRRVFVALLADNVRSLDGQAAFYLQLNCVLSSQEMEKFPAQAAPRPAPPPAPLPLLGPPKNSSTKETIMAADR